MGRSRSGKPISSKSYTLPSSPSHSSSDSSDFEFTISLSPRNKSSSSTLCPADELFYKGQLLPLQLSPRISMVRTLLLSSSSSSSSSTSTTTTTAARDSTARDSTDSHSSFNSDLALYPDYCDSSSSSRPSSVTTDDDDFRRLHNPNNPTIKTTTLPPPNNNNNKYFSLSRFSSVFRNNNNNNNVKTRESVKRMSATAKEVIRKYLKKVKPLYEKLSQQKHRASELSEDHQEQGMSSTASSSTVLSLLTRSSRRTERSNTNKRRTTKVENMGMGFLSHSFSGNLRYPRSRRSCVSSCPSSMRSSPTHSGVLSNFPITITIIPPPHSSSSMDELQSAIQGAITHCKNSLITTPTPTHNHNNQQH